VTTTTRPTGQRSPFEQRAFIMRDNIVLQCTECKERNYFTSKNKKKTTQRLEFRKFCRRCRKHVSHKETK
jgi:large subunit ribosomal protein L33